MEKQVLELFYQLESEIIKYNPYYDKALLNKAFEFAYKIHSGDLRLSKEPYITHSLHTALKLTKIEADDISIVCGLLHDVLDKKECTLDILQAEFGTEITNIVSGVYELGKIYYKPEMNSKEVDELKSKLVLVGDDIRIFLVKIADRFHNLETLDYLPKEKRYRIAKETQEVYIPIVNFLSIGEYLTDMYDLCFKHTNEKEYNKLYKIFGKKFEFYDEKITSTLNVLKLEFQRYGLEYVNLEGRVKTLNSIYRKLQSKKIDINQIYDVLALRIVLKNISDCYIALGIIHKLFKVKNDRFKDYISYPKNNGYQSIHTTVYDTTQDFIEFQIQTQEMYKLNKTGLAAHFIYKGFGVELQRLPNWMKDILNVQKKALDSKKFLEKLTQEVLISEIKVFDKAGNRFLLPKDSVLIDFAFESSFDAGKYFSGAFINGVFISDPFYKLENGSIIKLQKSKEVFLDYKVESFFHIKTKKARDAMKDIFQNYSKVKLSDLGKYLLNNALEIYGLRHFHYQPALIKQKTYKKFSILDEENLYLLIAIGSFEYNDIANYILTISSKKDFKNEISLKVFTKSNDYTCVNSIIDLIYNLNVDLLKVSYSKERNYIFLDTKIIDKDLLDNLVSEIKRQPNVLGVSRVFPFRLKVYYGLLTLFISLSLVFSFLLNIFYIQVQKSRFYIDMILFFEVLIFVFLVFFLRYIVRRMLPDVLKYKRFYLSLGILNTFMLTIVGYNGLIVGFDKFILLYILAIFTVYLRLLYNYKKLKKSQKF